VSAAIEEHTVDVGGMPTRYFAAGAGPPLMLLHGDGDGAFDWSWTLQALARTRRAYAPDLPGSGENAKLAADYSPPSSSASPPLPSTPRGSDGPPWLAARSGVRRAAAGPLGALARGAARPRRQLRPGASRKPRLVRARCARLRRPALARLPKGSLEIIPDCGHLPHVEWPDRFVKALGGFLQDGEPPVQSSASADRKTFTSGGKWI
jgi:pimeloyl-ACP methyl ester carboxylesterase